MSDVSDINFLPQEYKKKEDKEKKHSAPREHVEFSVPEERSRPEESSHSLQDTFSSLLDGAEKTIHKLSQSKEDELGRENMGGKESEKKESTTVHKTSQGIDFKPLSERKHEPAAVSSTPKKSWLKSLFNKSSSGDPSKGRILEERVVQEKEEVPDTKKNAQQDKGKDHRKESHEQKNTQREHKEDGAKHEPEQKTEHIIKEQKQPQHETEPKVTTKEEVHERLSSASSLPGASDKVDVNLLPEGQLLQSHTKKRILFMITSVSCAFGFAIIAYLFAFWQTQKVANINSELARSILRLDAQIRQNSGILENNEVLITQLITAENVMSSRHYWTHLLSKVEDITLETVYLKSITMSGNSIGTEVIAPNWVTAARQLLIWQSEIPNTWENLHASKVSQIVVSGLAGEVGEGSEATGQQVTQKGTSVGFSLDASVNPNFWLEDPIDT